MQTLLYPTTSKLKVEETYGQAQSELFCTSRVPPARMRDLAANVVTPKTILCARLHAHGAAHAEGLRRRHELARSISTI